MRGPAGSTAAKPGSETTQAVECWRSSGRGRPAQHSCALRDLNPEVAHTNAEVGQTLGVVEQARVGRIVVDQRRKVGGQHARPEYEGVKLLQRRQTSGRRAGRRGGRREALQRTRHRRSQLRQDALGVRSRRIAGGGSDRGALIRSAGWVGGLSRRGKRGHLAGRRRLARIAVHGRGVLRPHLSVLRLELRDQRRVLPEDVGLRRRCRLSTIGRDERRRYRRCERLLVCRGGCPGLGRSLLGLCGRLLHPGHVRLSRTGHGRRGRPVPPVACELRDHRLVALSSRLQLGGEAVPRRCGSLQ